MKLHAVMTEREASLLLRQLRDQSGLTQKALGEAAGVTSRTILEAERSANTQIPHGITVLRMLDAMEVLPRSEDPRPPGPLTRVEEKLDGVVRTLDDLAAYVREHLPPGASQEQANEG